MKSKVMLETERVVVATSGRVMVGHFFASPSAEDLKTLGDREVAWAEEQGGKVAVLTMISPSVGMKMDGSVRAAAADVQSRCDRFMAANVTVIEERGFFASIARSVIVSISLLSRSAAPTHAVGSREDGAAYAADKLTAAGHPTTKDDVLAVIEDVMSRAVTAGSDVNDAARAPSPRRP